MTKICGFLAKRPMAEQESSHLLRQMLLTMKHEPGDEEHYLLFPGGRGGIALLRHPDEPIALDWSRSRDMCGAFAGYISEIPGAGGAGDPGGDGVGTVCARLLVAWERTGELLPLSLRGTFALALYDCRQQALHLVSDHFGMCPLYYHESENGFGFGAEVKSLLPLLDRVEPDWSGWADFFYLGHMLETNTLIKGVRSLGAGEHLQIRSSGIKRRKYYDFTKIGVMDHAAISTEILVDRLYSAARRCVAGGQQNTLLLSGGFDSRLLLGVLCDLGIRPRLVSLRHADEHRGLDGALALEYARSLGRDCELRDTRGELDRADQWRRAYRILDGMVPNRNLFIMQVYAELDRQMGTVWDGLPLDMALGAYHGYGSSAEANLKRMAAMRERLRPALRAILEPEAFQALDRDFNDRLNAAHAAIPATVNQFVLFLLQSRTRNRIAVNPYKLYDARVSCVTPATDVDFLSYILSVPADIKTRNKFYMKMLGRHFPSLLKVPFCSSGNVFRGWANPMLIQRHYDWKLGARKWLEEHPRLKGSLLKARRLARAPQRHSPLLESAGGARFPGCRKVLPAVCSGPDGASVFDYLSTWHEDTRSLRISVPSS